MDEAAQAERRIQIETAAYALLALKGYKATSMLEVAKRAKASNETLYKWYGNKQGLFLSMVERNGEVAKAMLESSLTTHRPLAETLDAFGPQLLQTLLAERAIALHRAAAGDVHDTGTLGRTIFAAGRQAIIPLLARVFAADGEAAIPHEEAADLYLDVLLADLQIRRVIGVSGMPSPDQLLARAERARAVVEKMRQA